MTVASLDTEYLNVVSWSARSVRENLEIDEALARSVQVHGLRVLRFWWGGPSAVVIGRSERQDRVVNTLACSRSGIEIVRRATGGGSVLQTEGVLNYSLIMPEPGSIDIPRGFRYGTNLIVSLLRACGIEGQPAGVSDVAVGDRKISGSAQARRWHALLVHGTLLVNFDFDLAEAVLHHPEREPEYRHKRPHREFLVTLADLGADTSPESLISMGPDAARQVFGSDIVRERTGAWLMSHFPLRGAA